MTISNPMVIPYVVPSTKHVPPMPTANHNGATRPKKSAANVLTDKATSPNPIRRSGVENNKEVGVGR